MTLSRRLTSLFLRPPQSSTNPPSPLPPPPPPPDPPPYKPRFSLPRFTVTASAEPTRHTDTERLEWLLSNPHIHWRKIMVEWPWQRDWRDVIDSTMDAEATWTELVRKFNQRGEGL